MKLTKRILCLLLAMALTCALCACGGDTTTDDDSNQTTTTTNDMGGNLDGDNVYNDGVFGEW